MIAFKMKIAHQIFFNIYDTETEATVASYRWCS
jgi:hypothetical protein